MNSALLKRLRQFAASRHNQRKAPFFVVEGLRCCQEALARRPQWVEAVLLADDIAETPNGREFAESARQAGSCGKAKARAICQKSRRKVAPRNRKESICSRKIPPVNRRKAVVAVW